MRLQHGVANGDQAYAKPLEPRVAQQPLGRLSGSNSPLAAAAPWFIAALAVVLVAAFLSRGDTHAAAARSSEPQHYSLSETDVAERLAMQQNEINRLASKVDSLAEKVTAFRVPENVGVVAAPTRKTEHHPDNDAAARAAMEQDLDKLRQYVKDVADSVAILDTQMSDPAVLQKKLEHQRALTRQ